MSHKVCIPDPNHSRRLLEHGKTLAGIVPTKLHDLSCALKGKFEDGFTVSVENVDDAIGTTCRKKCSMRMPSEEYRALRVEL